MNILEKKLRSTGKPRFHMQRAYSITVLNFLIATAIYIKSSIDKTTVIVEKYISQKQSKP